MKKISKKLARKRYRQAVFEHIDRLIEFDDIAVLERLAEILNIGCGRIEMRIAELKAERSVQNDR